MGILMGTMKLSILHVHMQKRCEIKATEIETFLSSDSLAGTQFSFVFFFSIIDATLSNHTHRNWLKHCLEICAKSVFVLTLRSGELIWDEQKIYRFIVSSSLPLLWSVFYVYLHKMAIHFGFWLRNGENNSSFESKTVFTSI